MRLERESPAETGEGAWIARWPAGRQLGLFIQSVQEYAIFMLDPTGHVVTWNEGAERLKGYAKEEILGKHFSTFYTEEDRERHHPESNLEIARNEGRLQEDGWRRRKDGTLFYANIVLTAVRDEKGNLIGFGKVTRDLTQHKLREEQERELRKEQSARVEAEAENRAKSDLLAILAHELRSPLTAMLSYTDLLLAGIPEPLPKASKKQIERIRAAAHHLRQLIEQILTFSRIQLGQEEAKLEACDLGELVHETADLIEPLVRRKNLGFAVDAPSSPVAIRTDPTKFRQILWNLLSNAVKFTNEGEVVLAVQMTADKMILEVRDTGPGVPADEIERIFEPFHQAGVESRRRGGTGLGLSVAKRLSEIMGGAIGAQSTVGRGSTFTVWLPRG